MALANTRKVWDNVYITMHIKRILNMQEIGYIPVESDPAMTGKGAMCNCVTKLWRAATMSTESPEY